MGDQYRLSRGDGWKPATEGEMHQALLFASYPHRISKVRMVVYANKYNANFHLLKATAPFPVTVVSLGGEWKGTVDKLIGFWSFFEVG